MNVQWTSGNAAQLLENGEAFFPAVFDAIRHARQEVLLETFIVFEDKVGRELQQVLIDAARRGVQVDMMVDGFGSAELTPAFIDSLTAAGVRLRRFDPSSRVFGLRFNVLRRMHRKIVVVDAQQAFIGGINFSADHLMDFGPQAKQDYAVRLQGPVVDEIRFFALEAIREAPAPRAAQLEKKMCGSAAGGDAEALFVTRDNADHPNDIERQYRAAIGAARKRVLIANAYFFPGYLLLRELRRAARRGVDVRLILQGEPDMAIVKTASGLLHDQLQRAGVKIHEYCKRPLHGKVAVVDDDWSTVGSSNLDPLSLSLNLEANVVLRHREFAQRLSERLDYLIVHECREVAAQPEMRGRWWVQIRSTLVFHVLRHFPKWLKWLPSRAPRLVSAGPPSRPGDLPNPQGQHGR